MTRFALSLELIERELATLRDRLDQLEAERLELWRASSGLPPTLPDEHELSFASWRKAQLETPTGESYARWFERKVRHAPERTVKDCAMKFSGGVVYAGEPRFPWPYTLRVRDRGGVVTEEIADARVDPGAESRAFVILDVSERFLDVYELQCGRWACASCLHGWMDNPASHDDYCARGASSGADALPGRILADQVCAAPGCGLELRNHFATSHAFTVRAQSAGL